MRSRSMKYIRNPVSGKKYKILPKSSKFSKSRKINGLWTTKGEAK